MVNESEVLKMIKKAKESSKKLKFKQSIDLIMTFKDIDVKKGFAINEIIQLPKTSAPALVCVMATGDMNLKAKTAKADMVVDTDELNKLGTNKRESRKFVGRYDFFLADTKLMPLVGKVLGQILGPRGKMPTPVPFNAPIESFLDRFRSSVRVRVRSSLAMSCKIGNEGMDDADLVANALVIINAVEKKLPNGEKNIKRVLVKTTMGPIIKQVIQARKKG
ncbi:MAG: ribosomal protein L1 [Cenarchaeum symbiont of Oopsacas minuta]|nr:ribosomal protein L1 [Cenarchaeum symbiont of Oopsacas minuta]